MSNLEIRFVGGGVTTVASRRVDGEWRCTALQFDIVGTGATKEAAFSQLKELVCDYVCHMAKQKGKVAFFNPSERDEWEVADKQDYVMVVAAFRHNNKSSFHSRPLRFNDLRSMTNVEKIDLVPAPAFCG